MPEMCNEGEIIGIYKTKGDRGEERENAKTESKT